MRYVDRNAVPVPASLVSGPGKDERDKAELHFSVPNPSGRFEFKAYKSADVVDALAKLFCNKCAYCESRYAVVQPMDVEHFRPKGGVYGAPNHPGYWWLAADWTNLLPSCIDCNRRRYHDIFFYEPDGLAGIRQARAPAGKQGHFPIAAPIRAASAGESLLAEEPLLIDPTARDPNAYLTWATGEKNGTRLSFAVPRLSGNTKDPYAAASIEIFGLNRPALVEERSALLNRLDCEFQNLQRAIRLASKCDSAELADELSGIREQFSRFVALGDVQMPYSACARDFIAEKCTTLVNNLEQLATQCKPVNGGSDDAMLGRISHNNRRN